MKNWLEKLQKIEEMAIGYALLLIALAATVQVVLRYAFGIAYDWVDEGARYMTIVITFVGAGVCVRYGTHFSMDALVQYASNRMKHFLKVMAHMISAITMAVIFYYSWIQIGKLHMFGATTPSLQLPMFVPYLPIGIFTFLISVRFLIQAVRHARAFVTNEPFDSCKRGH